MLIIYALLNQITCNSKVTGISLCTSTSTTCHIALQFHVVRSRVHNRGFGQMYRARNFDPLCLNYASIICGLPSPTHLCKVQQCLIILIL